VEEKDETILEPRKKASLLLRSAALVLRQKEGDLSVFGRNQEGGSGGSMQVAETRKICNTEG